jgi:hypothetical protein
MAGLHALLDWRLLERIGGAQGFSLFLTFFFVTDFSSLSTSGFGNDFGTLDDGPIFRLRSSCATAGKDRVICSTWRARAASRRSACLEDWSLSFRFGELCAGGRPSKRCCTFKLVEDCEPNLG